MKTNDRIYGIYFVLKKALPIWFVFLLYLLSKGLNYTEAILLDSFSAFTAILFEVPSGILADKISRKRLLIVGEMIIALNYVFLLLSNNYWCFVFGALMSGVGQACVSGTGEALIYDEFSDVEIYKKYMGKLNKYSYIIVAVGTFSSSWIFEINTDLPMIISLVLEVFAILVLILFYDEKRVIYESKPQNAREEVCSQLAIIKRYATNKNVIYITILNLIMLEIISNLNYTTQAYLPSLGLEVRYLGVVLLVFNIISAIGAKTTEKMTMNGKLWLLIYVVLLLLTSVPMIVVVILSLCISRFINGFIWTLISAETNKLIKSAERATALSYINLVTELLPMFIDPIIALSYDINGFSITYRILAFALLLIVIIVSLYKIVRKE